MDTQSQEPLNVVNKYISMNKLNMTIDSDSRRRPFDVEDTASISQTINDHNSTIE